MLNSDHREGALVVPSFLEYNLIMISKWIEFVDWGKSDSGKTKMWGVFTKDTSIELGEVKWFTKWRKYAFFPNTETIFEEECLRDISFFVEQKTRKHRLKK